MTNVNYYGGTGGAGDSVSKIVFSGDQLSGSDGDTNRILTLNNSSTTKLVDVSLDGLEMEEDRRYTVAHSGSLSTITFLVRVKNSQVGEVLYVI